MKPDRRGLISRALTLGGALALSACDRIGRTEPGSTVLRSAEGLNKLTHRLLLGRSALAQEFGEKDISKVFKANGTINPSDVDYRAHAASGFVDWALVVDGLVDRPQRLSLADLRAMPARTQITRHDCVEGWSSVGKWKGTPLARIIDRAGLRSSAKFLVFHCADTMESDAAGKPIRYYESIDLVDAFHPQTILAWEMNGKTLPVAHGAPIRLRVERQLGYKHAKYVMRIEAVDSLKPFGKGKGGYWEDNGYEWYAGI